MAVGMLRCAAAQWAGEDLHDEANYAADARHMLGSALTTASFSAC